MTRPGFRATIGQPGGVDIDGERIDGLFDAVERLRNGKTLKLI